MICQNYRAVFQTTETTAALFSQNLISLAAVWLPLCVKPERCRSGGALDEGRGVDVCVSTSTTVILRCGWQQEESGVRNGFTV